MKCSSELLSLYVDEDLSLCKETSPECDAKAYAASALRSSLLKKFMDGDRNDAADNAALLLFLKVNEELLTQPRDPADLVDEYLMGELKNSLEKYWWLTGEDPLVPSYTTLFNEGRVGPGSSIGLKETDLYSKLFSSKLTATSSSLYLEYTRPLSSNPRWQRAEEFRRCAYDSVEVVQHSRLSFVPKRSDISRTICTEPSLNMFFQLGLGQILTRRTKYLFGIDLALQPRFNRELAREGSRNGKYSTIDLSSASDSLSVGVLKAILPEGFFNLLMELRTSTTKLPDGRLVPLNMISSMGNGFTFPLETLIFTAVVVSAYRISGIPLKRNADYAHGNFGVFGDDIIVMSEVAPAVLRLLKLLGFTVNADKTFVEGPFRESCGGDFFRGHHVRGVHIKTLQTQQDRYVAINALNDWSAMTGIPLCRAVQYLLRSVRRVLVPPDLGLDAGIHCPISLVGRNRADENGSIRYRFYQARPSSIEIRDDGTFSGSWATKKPNYYGLLLAFLNGNIRNHRIGRRKAITSYAQRSCKTPNWGVIHDDRMNTRFSTKQWETAAWINLTVDIPKEG